MYIYDMYIWIILSLHHISTGQDDEVHQAYLVCRQPPMRPGNTQEWAAYINDSKQNNDFGGDQRIGGIQC